MNSGLEKVISNQPLKLLYENRILSQDLGAGTQYESQVYCEKLRSSYLLDEAKVFEQQLFEAGIEFSRLKGAYLVQCGVYEEGQRLFSDLDYLISPKHLNHIKTILIKKGFVEHIQTKWKANRNRFAYFKRDGAGLLLSIDIHTTLFWNQHENHFLMNSVNISAEEHFLYMIYNYSVQDNFVGFYKLNDLHGYYTANKSNLDIDALMIKAEHYGIQRACRICFFLLNKIFETGIVSLEVSWFESWISKSLLKDNYLFSPGQSRLKYILIKFFMKDSVIESLEYYLRWIAAYLPSILRGLIRR